MARNPHTNNRMQARIYIVLVLIAVIGFGILIGRLYYLQINEGEKYQTLALKQQLRPTEITAQRGTIYDRNRKTLAASATVWTVTISPAELKDEAQLDLIADYLSELLDVDREKIMERGQKTASYYEIIKAKVEQDVADEITAFCLKNEIKCVNLIEDSRRYYPYGDLASTVLGFTGSENKGAYGIESNYEKALSGTSGMILTVKNAKSGDMPYSYEQRYEAVDGNSLVLTLDEVVQHSLETHIETAIVEHNVQKGAIGVVMDVKTGAILGMTTKPDFDPNEPTVIADAAIREYIETLEGEEKSKALQTEQFDQWRNKVISDAYEPGSVFKIVTGAMALDGGATEATGIYYNCTGSYTVAGREKSCWKKAGHGTIDFTHAVMYSCNPAFMMISEKIGAKTFQDYFERFGLKDPTGIDLPGEAEGFFYSDLVEYDKQSPEYLASSSFGQTFTVTPIQMITAVAAAVNGGSLMEPYVVAQIVDSDGNVVSTTEPTLKRQVISKENSEVICDILEQVVCTEDGSGRKAYVPGYRIGGKTGTSQKLTQITDDGQEGYMVSFVGVAPMDDPQIAVLVVLDEPIVANIYGSVIAAPVVGAVMSDILPYLGVDPVYTEQEAANNEVKVPKVTGQLLHDATSALTIAQLSYKTIGEGVTVVRQLPESDTECPKGTTVFLYTDEEAVPTPIEVPDVTGMSPQQANRTILNAGLNIRLAGEDVQSKSAVAASQEPAAGTVAEAGTVITVNFALIP